MDAVTDLVQTSEANDKDGARASLALNERFAPANFEELGKLATMVASSGLVPDALRGKSADTMLVLMQGADIGLTPMQALQNLHVVNGKVGVAAHLQRSRAMNSPAIKVFQVLESGPTKCVILAQRHEYPEPSRVEYTIEEAQKAGLTGKDNWKKHPTDMLLARCTSRAVSQHCPEVRTDFPNTLEEIRDMPPEVVNVTPEGEAPKTKAEAILLNSPGPTIEVDPPLGTVSVPPPQPGAKSQAEAKPPAEKKVTKRKAKKAKPEKEDATLSETTIEMLEDEARTLGLDSRAVGFVAGAIADREGVAHWADLSMTFTDEILDAVQKMAAKKAKPEQAQL